MKGMEPEPHHLLLALRTFRMGQVDGNSLAPVWFLESKKKKKPSSPYEFKCFGKCPPSTVNTARHGCQIPNCTQLPRAREIHGSCLDMLTLYSSFFTPDDNEQTSCVFFSHGPFEFTRDK